MGVYTNGVYRLLGMNGSDTYGSSDRTIDNDRCPRMNYMAAGAIGRITVSMLEAILKDRKCAREYYRGLGRGSIEVCNHLLVW